MRPIRPSPERTHIMQADPQPTSSLSWQRTLTLLALISGLILLGLSVYWHTAQEDTPNGLQRTHTGRDGYVRTGNWLWATIDGDNFTNEDGLEYVNHVRMEGVVHVGASAQTQTWRILHTGNVRIYADGDLIFSDDDGANEVTSETITFTPNDSTIALLIDADVDINTARTVYPYRTQFGIYEQSIFGGWSLLPPHKLYNDTPADSLVTNSLIQSLAQRIAFFTFMFALLSLLALHGIRTKIWQSKMAWAVLALIILSAILRFVIMAERLPSDPFFHFLVPAGDDNYVLMGKMWLSGDYQLAGTFWPPAPIMYFAGIVWLLGAPLTNVYIINILLSALATGAVTLAGWFALDDKRVGLFSGALSTLYPPLMFYQVTTQSVVLDAALIAFAVMFGVLSIRHKSFTYAAVFGVMISLAGMSRGTALLLGLAFFLGLLYQSTRADLLKGIQLTTIAAICSLLTLAPQILLNASATGEWSLVPYSNGSLTLYSGNNRDADGIWTGRGTAWELERLSGQHWNEAFAEDFADDPVRMLQLNLRKFGIFFNNFEYVSNVDFIQQGTGESRLLATLSQNGVFGMAMLSFFVWIGTALWLPKRDSAVAFLLWSMLLVFLGTALFVLAGRLRVPLMPLLMIASATALVSLWDALRQRTVSLALGIGVACAIALSFIMSWLDANLPQQRYTDISDRFIQRDFVFADELRLITFDPIEADLTPDGYFYITLYWELLAPASHDYEIAIELATPNERIAGIDLPLGSISYPPTPATEMPVGAVLREGYLLRLPDELPDIAQVNVVVYTPDRDVVLSAPDGTTDTAPRATLFNVGITQPNPTL
ncbi:MAG: hypothetical protein AAF126_13325, partial [Chloroflexota bacterium]